MAQSLPLRNWVQFAMIVSLIAGSFAGSQTLLALTAVLALVSTLLEWNKLLKLARLFSALAVACSAVIALWMPDKLPVLWHALVQGVSFAALMMVLGMLRRPVRQSDYVRQGTEYLFTFEPRRRYAAVNIGSHFLSLLFNVGMIAMIGDLAQAGGRDAIARRPLVLGAMRGAALVSIWSPIGLGFAIVTAGIPALDPLLLMATSFGLTILILAVTSVFPQLPGEAKSDDRGQPRSAQASTVPLITTLGICILLLVLTVGLHLWLDISFTLASVTVLPLFTAIWLGVETGFFSRYHLGELKQALTGLSDLRSESAIFLSANVIGAAVSTALASVPGWIDFIQHEISVLPLLIGTLILIPLAAACFIPNSIFVVILAQLLGSSPIGVQHPLAVGVTLSVAWASAVAISPISAMCLIVANHSDVSSRRVAWLWNVRFAGTILLISGCVVTIIICLG